MLMIGGVFGAAWIRFGARGPQFVGIGIAIVLILALIVILPVAPDILAGFELWWLAIAAGCVIADLVARHLAPAPFGTCALRRQSRAP